MSSTTSDPILDTHLHPGAVRPAGMPRNPTHYGVVVGIDHYPSYADFAPLQHARRDARQFYNWLVDPQRGSLPAGQVRLITPTDAEVEAFTRDPEQAWPVLDRVTNALDDFGVAVSSLRDDDPDGWERSRLWFFGAGHGAAPGNGQSALLMANVRATVPGRNMEMFKYADWYQKCAPFAEVVLLTDCCRNYMPDIEGWGPPFLRCFPQPNRTTIVLGFATGFGDPAYEPVDGDPDSKRGYFTGALLDGLDGHGADPRTHQVTAASLKKYVEDQVRLRSEAVHKEQFAELNVVFGQAMVLTEVPGIPAEPEYPVTIEFGPGRTGMVVLLNSDLVTERGRWTGRDGPWRLPLPRGLYEARYEAEPPVTVRVAGGDVHVQL
jgi:hypothetical protein